MYLKRLEVQGFKTLAQKTGLEFVPDASGRRGVTAVVGPNGSGKSNIADALRWVMGEQSLKLLRGKKSEDVIFSGSETRARSGFAEVSMLLENDDRPDVEQAEVVITRRLYRDGQSEYEINRQSARLQDVVMLLAQCGIGQRTYSVIGQGMVDHVLVASPAERKEFFDEAFGLRPFQLKRQSALNKIEASHDHLTQTEALLREIEPRLQTLARQARRLQEREGLERELKDLERAYYGHAWQDLRRNLDEVRRREAAARGEEASLENEAKILEEELRKMEVETPQSDGFSELRHVLDRLLSDRAELREQQMQFETKRAVAAVRAEKPWSPLPLSRIIERVDTISEKHEALFALIQSDKPNAEEIKKLVIELKALSVDLVAKLQRPAPEPEKEIATDPETEKEVAALAGALSQVAEKIAEVQRRMETWNSEEQDKRKHIFETQHRLTQKRQAAQTAERRAADAAIEVARFETRSEAFYAELRQHAPHLENDLETLASSVSSVAPEAAARLQRLRSQLEWIGGIDTETLKEYETTKERHAFLSQQSEDVRSGLTALELVVQELDQTIRGRSETAFQSLDREFNVFFKKLFGGGEAKLVEIQAEPETDEQGNIIAEAEERATGIEIQATPPGKRFKSIALLSGGERALTSIALICAIMATNPSPFVVLDEVDAALDESNSRKFAEIIHDLSDKTQFVVVTHNRATMARANILYGVTMGDDGVSQLLSVKLEDVEKLRHKQTA